MLKAATNFIVNEKGEEVISERHQKDYKKDEETVVTEEVETKTTESFTDVSFDDI
jgi:phage terminase large subunit